jgi:hypothetical protein
MRIGSSPEARYAYLPLSVVVESISPPMLQYLFTTPPRSAHGIPLDPWPLTVVIDCDTQRFEAVVECTGRA